MKHETHKVLYNLPKIPQHFEDRLATLYTEDYKKKSDDSNYLSMHHNNQPFANYCGRPVRVGGKTIAATQSARYLLDEDIRTWIKQNIVDSWTACNYAITPANNDCSLHAAHIDNSRAYLLIYLFDNGGDQATACWYQEHGFPVYRPTDLGYAIKDYSTISLVEKHRPPQRTWFISNVLMLHGVENITRDRTAIHVGLTEENCQGLLSRYKYLTTPDGPTSDFPDA
jgi:hypothetical protein